MDSDESEDSDAAGMDQSRADSIKAYLMSKGIDGSRIFIETKGSTVPLVFQRNPNRTGKKQKSFFRLRSLIFTEL